MDFKNGEWHEVSAWAEAELKKARERNDAALSPDETAHLRGRISALKDLLALPRRVEAQASASGPL
jgi:hypothetical protein